MSEMAQAGEGQGRRILYLVNEAYFFLSHRLALARAAQAAGYDVHVAAPEDHVWAPAGFDVDAIRAAGFTFHAVPLNRRGRNPLQDLRTFACLHRLIREVGPDIVHGMTIKPVIYGGIAARLAGVPARVSLVTGLGHIFIARGWAAAVLRRAVLLAYRVALGGERSRVIFQNPDNRDVLAAAGAVPLARTLVVRGSGVSLGTFRPVPEPEGPVTVVLPARLIWEKGIAEFVEAARRMRRPGLRFALVGDTKASNPRAVPEAMLRAWVEEGAVEWWGRRDDMPAVFAAAHIVCMPSTYGEGVPKVLIEAAAAGRAIVTTDIPGCREVVRHGLNGLLVPPGDVSALVEALEKLVADAPRRRIFGDAGRRLAEEEFSEDDVARRTLVVYRDLLAAGAASAVVAAVPKTRS